MGGSDLLSQCTFVSKCLVDARRTWGGGQCPTTNSCVINHRASLLPVKSSIVDLVNVCGPGYRWSTR